MQCACACACGAHVPVLCMFRQRAGHCTPTLCQCWDSQVPRRQHHQRVCCFLHRLHRCCCHQPRPARWRPRTRPPHEETPGAGCGDVVFTNSTSQLRCGPHGLTSQAKTCMPHVTHMPSNTHQSHSHTHVACHTSNHSQTPDQSHTHAKSNTRSQSHTDAKSNTTSQSHACVHAKSNTDLRNVLSSPPLIVLGGPTIVANQKLRVLVR